MAEPLIHTRALAKDYRMGETVVHALSDVSVDIEAGAFVAIMGPSGSGKSTLMNLLGCLDRPSAGSYRLDGVDVSELSADELAETRNRKIGFVFQTFNLLPRTSALDNVQVPLLYGRVGRALRRRRADAVLAELGLTDRKDHQPSQLSGGQQQRVAIARALIGEPRIILADEPTGALDTRTGLEIMGVFQRLNRAGMTVIMVTHEADVARFATRELRFQDGRVVDESAREAPPDAEALLAERPAGAEAVQ